LKKILIVSPFAVFIGIFNPFFDTGTMQVFGTTFSAGWISFLSILMKFTLTICAALLLIATTSFPGVCHALRRLGLPALFVSQLLFLYRYLFVLIEEAMRIIRARDMRTFGQRGMDAHTAIRIIGALFLRTVERAERIYGAMLARGFNGDMPAISQPILRIPDLLFAGTTVSLLVVFRLYSVPEIIGRFIQELVR
jgi:cobalt/nickel transport system permease protein